MSCHTVFGCSGHCHTGDGFELTNLLIESITLSYIGESILPIQNRIDELDFDIENRLDYIDNELGKIPLVGGKIPDTEVLTADGSSQNLKNTMFSTELAKQKLDTGITVTSKKGSLPISQAVKNAQTISMVEYGAKGDGVSNDTAAFALLESNVTGQRIDLQGKTYKIDSISRYRNDYYNGYFKVGGSLITANGEFKLYGTKATTSINIKRDAQVSTSREMYKLIKGGLSKNNVVQSIAVDEVNGYIYTHHITSTGYAHEVSIINRYQWDDEGTTDFIDYSTEVKDIGHQGLAVQYLDDGSTKLWGASPYANAGGSEDSVVRFTYVPSDEGYINDVETFQLFPKSTRGGAASPTVSYCGNFLVAEQNHTMDGVSGNWIRIFNLHNLTTPGDYSNQYLSEFFVSVTHGTGEAAFQSMACDGAYIYIVSGNADIKNDMTIAVYNMVGELVTEQRKLEVGKDLAAKRGSGTFYEPEGLCIATINGTPRLLLQIAMNDGGNRDCRVYALGDNSVYIKGLNGTPRPSYVSRNSTIDYGVMVNEILQLGTYNPRTKETEVTATLSPSGVFQTKSGLKAGTGMAAWSGVAKPEEVANTSWRVWDKSIDATHNITQVLTNASASDAFNFARYYAGGSDNTEYADAVFTFKGDGVAQTDGTWETLGADYAEYFEWADGNPTNEDRRGYLVSLVDGKIKIAESEEVVIGVISSSPSVVGNSAWSYHHAKYIKDKYNTYILDEKGCKIPNPDYNESLEYIGRAERQEWGLVGLLGRIVINDGQTIPKNWVKLSRTSEDTCEYLVR